MPPPRRSLAYLAVTLILTACALPSPLVMREGEQDAIPSGVQILPAVTTMPTTGEDARQPARPQPTTVAEAPVPTAWITLTVLYTNDEHGWMAGVEPGRGAANLVGLWRQQGYGADEPLLLLSGGDNWTGPAISTWFDGESMVEVMNAMGYAASVIGNHEFDFGLYALQSRLHEAEFPYLSANLRRKIDSQVPTDLGIRPYAMVEAGGLQVGLIGLTTRSTPGTTNPTNVTEFDFIDYEQALREVVPVVQAAGADLILVPAHVCLAELLDLARRVEDLGIDLLGGGHCNELEASQIGDIVVIAGGAHLASYAYATFAIDTILGTAVAVDLGVRDNRSGPEDPIIAQIVAHWQEATDAELDQVIGYLEQEVPRRSQAMNDLIVESWLASYPADIAITNLGGIRDRLPAGPVTLAHVIGVLPFNNTLVEVKLSGQELDQVLVGKVREVAVAGMHRDGLRWVLDSTGDQLLPDHIYRVLLNDFMYAGGDDFELLAFFDPDAYDTTISWRQPVIDWIVAQESTPDHPLDAAIAGLAD